MQQLISEIQKLRQTTLQKTITQRLQEFASVKNHRTETGGIKRQLLLKFDVPVVLNTREIHSSTDEWISVS